MSGRTRWLVRHEHPVTEQDLAGDGTVSDDAVVRWVEAARRAYLDRCAGLRQAGQRRGLVVQARLDTLPRGTRLGRPTGVAVTASAAEVWPHSFTITVRLRPGGGGDVEPVNATCVIRFADRDTGEVRELGDEVRDELIALEHTARHVN